MVFRPYFSGSDTEIYRPPIARPAVTKPLAALVSTEQYVSRSAATERLEPLRALDDVVFGHAAQLQRKLGKSPQNEEQFNKYIGLSFVKGMTERASGRTIIIVGSDAHHGDAMLGQFPGVVWDPNGKKTPSYGDTIRWITVGGVRDGFVGLELKEDAGATNGIARTLDDVRFIASTLVTYGMSRAKQLYVLTPPYIVESPTGKSLRELGLRTLGDYIMEKRKR